MHFNTTAMAAGASFQTCAWQTKNKKLIRVMRLTAIILLSACLAASATGHSQRVSINMKNAPIQKVFKELVKQTGVSIICNAALIENAKPVTIKLSNATVEEIIGKCLEGLPLTYTVEGGSIIIKPKEKSPNENDVTLSGVEVRPPIDVHGRVVNEKGEAVEGVTVTEKGTKNATATNSNGEFVLRNVNDNASLVFTSINMEAFEVKVNGRSDLAINLKTKVSTLGDVQVEVNTGYQRIPKERATGSFDQISNELLNRRVSTNVLDRLEGVASGVRFQTNLPTFSKESRITVRGKSTIFSNTSPLIILDNFPYDGDVNNINPNDVESITVLKDAAATSIWGAYSGNGVIVITTKKGRLNQALKTEVNYNITVGQKPDLYYDPNYMSSSNMIAAETFLFNSGNYASAINNATTRPIVSPVVEILNNRKLGLISAGDSASRLDALSQNDIRRDYEKYFYRKAVNQQGAINLSGGGANATYTFSIGYNKDLSSLVNNEYNRLTIANFTTFSPIKYLELSSGLTYVQTTTDNNNNGFNTATTFPYSRIVDNQGNPLAISKDYRYAFIDTTNAGKILDWHYRPLDELNIANNGTKTYDIRINPSIRYRVFNWLNLEVRYQYERQTSTLKNLQSVKSYFVRNLINLYTQVNGNAIIRKIPLGDILDQTNTELTSKRLRAQLNIDKTFSNLSSLTALVGIETGEVISNSNGLRYYAYDEKNAASASALDYQTLFPRYFTGSSSIPYINTISGTNNETVSYFANTAYTYKGKYSYTLSGRIDQANIFGVDFNNKSVPLWSTGILWRVDKENFYHIHWMPYAALRITYGYNGNINTALNAKLSATYQSTATIFGIPFGIINNAPNNDLSWEKTGMVNVGFDFGLTKSLIEGSIEYYHKNTKDLIGATILPPSSGYTSLQTNSANMSGNGIDLDLRTNQITGIFSWFTNLLFSYNTDKVTKYGIQAAVGSIVPNSGFTSVINPVVGKPVYSVYSYRWAGLDPITGDPQGFSGKDVSKSYAALVNNVPFDSVVYNGPALPRFFGALRNTFSYKKLSLSVNITYKLAYVFRASSINYSTLYNSYAGHKDFANRWQKPGDENLTNVPSMIYPVGFPSYRDIFYSYSELLVHKGDHIRLQDIRLAYSIDKNANSKLPVSNIQLYVYVNNVGLLWKANKIGIDPDYLAGYPNPRTMSLGIRCTL